jgi:hypothetical protein
MRSAAFRCLTKSAHLALARIVVGLAVGRSAITQRQFVLFGISRDSVTAAVVELETLGLVVVQRSDGPHPNVYTLSQRWRDIATLADAVQVRDKARAFGLTRRRKVERATARRSRLQRIEQIRAALDAPQSAPALAALDHISLNVLGAIVDDIAQQRGAVAVSLTYERLCDLLNLHRNRLAASLRVLSALGLITVERGRRRASRYKIAEEWRSIVSIEQAQIIAAEAATGRRAADRGRASRHDHGEAATA